MGKVKKNHNRPDSRKSMDDGKGKGNQMKHSIQVLDSDTTKKILKQARRQQNEELELVSERILPGVKLSDTVGQQSEQVDDRELYDELKLNPEDEAALNDFRNRNGKKVRNLYDIVLEKINKASGALQETLTDVDSLHVEDIDPRIRQMYEGVRDIMKRYRSGKVPKAFKILPKLKNWEQILFITEPNNWSAAAIYQGTRLFSSALSQNMAQKFYNLILLPRIRDDLAEFKKLNTHLYNSLRKALFKPAAFMKGIIIPLLESGDCTLREAVIFGSIIAKSSIPALHSSACLLKICEMDYSGANSIFIRIFLDKRYALPYRVVDAAVFHFLRFELDGREMPVLWFQSLLTFVERYKNDISSDQRDALFGLLRKKFHPRIGPEIVRELKAATPRDIEMMQ